MTDNRKNGRLSLKHIESLITEPGRMSVDDHYMSQILDTIQRLGNGVPIIVCARKTQTTALMAGMLSTLGYNVGVGRFGAPPEHVPDKYMLPGITGDWREKLQDFEAGRIDVLLVTTGLMSAGGIRIRRENVSIMCTHLTSYRVAVQLIACAVNNFKDFDPDEVDDHSLPYHHRVTVVDKRHAVMDAVKVDAAAEWSSGGIPDEARTLRPVFSSHMLWPIADPGRDEALFVVELGEGTDWNQVRIMHGIAGLRPMMATHHSATGDTPTMAFTCSKARYLELCNLWGLVP